MKYSSKLKSKDRFRGANHKFAKTNVGHRNFNEKNSVPDRSFSGGPISMRDHHPGASFRFTVRQLRIKCLFRVVLYSISKIKLFLKGPIQGEAAITLLQSALRHRNSSHQEKGWQQIILLLHPRLIYLYASLYLSHNYLSQVLPSTSLRVTRHLPLF